MKEKYKLKTNNEKVTIDDYYYYYLLKCEDTLNKLNSMIEGDLDGFYTINEFGGCNDIIEILEIYRDKLKELKDNTNKIKKE